MQLARTLNALVLGAAFIATVDVSAQSLPEYHVTRLDDMIETVFPNVMYPSSDSRALNESGDLGGEAWVNNSQMRGFIYTVEHGVVALPNPPGWPSAAVRDMSDRDQNGEVVIVGCGTYGVHTDIAIGPPVLWRFSTVTGTVLKTRVITPPAGFDDGMAVGVSNDGAVAGFSGLTGAFVNWKYDVATDLLETFDFPTRITDMNDVGQVCGGVYRGDLLGNYEDLSETYEPGEVMPSWAIENGGISASWRRINDQGWVVGRAPTGISDGAGHLQVAIVRFADPIGWTAFDVVSHLDLAAGMNNGGDFMNRFGGAYFEEMGDQFSLNALLTPEHQGTNVYRSEEINGEQQVAGAQAHAFLLTPLGRMIIPGDVNGDVTVDMNDQCAWVANPIDLNGDSVVNAADVQWLTDRLAVFGFIVEDCNADGVPDACEPDCDGNGTPDPCDIQDGTSEDCNGNGIPDGCESGGTTEAMNVFNPPVDLVAGGTFIHDIVVAGAGIVDDVDFTIDIDYRIGYLSVLLEHDGTTITLIDRPGHPQDGSLGNGQLGYDIVLDDEGTGGAIEDQGNFGQPVAPIVSPPSYTPNDALSAFDGMPSEGTWTLHIVMEPNMHPVHLFNDWGLTITRAAIEVGACGCPADLDADGIIGFADLSAMLNKWGGCAGCAEDFDANGNVGFSDLVYVLNAWGPCE